MSRQILMDFPAATIRRVLESLPIKPIDQAFLIAIAELAEDRETYQGSLKSIGKAMRPPRGATTARGCKERLIGRRLLSVEEEAGQAHVFRIEWKAVFSDCSERPEDPSQPQPDPKRGRGEGDFSREEPLQFSEGTPPTFGGDPSNFDSGPLQLLEGTPPVFGGGPLQKLEPSGGVGNRRARAGARHTMAFKDLNSKSHGSMDEKLEGFPSGITPADLGNPAKVERLYRIAIALKWIREAPLVRLAVFTLAAHCRKTAKKPGAMFRSNLIAGRWYGRDECEAWAEAAIAELDRLPAADGVPEMAGGVPEMAGVPRRQVITARERDEHLAKLAEWAKQLQTKGEDQ